MVHRDSGFSFPAEVADFARGEVHQYDKTGRDVSVGYDHFRPRIVATFYVYPLEGLTLDQEFLRRQQEVTTMYPKALLVSTGTTRVSQRDSPALIATYAIPKMFDVENRPMKSLLLVSQRGDRFTEYRVSYAAADGPAADEAAQSFLQKFAWP